MNKYWPVLSYGSGKATYETLQLFTQIVGKIKLVTMPWINHSWSVTLHVTPTGLTTQTIPYLHNDFQIDFDFVSHQLKIITSQGESATFGLKGNSVADFYKTIQQKLKALQIEIDIFSIPSEIVNPIPFELDTFHNSYDVEQVGNFHLALLRIHEVFTHFRSGFTGKSSPIQFFWGGFDLSLSFFSGNTAPLHPGKMPGMPNWVLQDAFSHELQTVGFWAGNEDLNEAAFYCYLYPEPEAYQVSTIEPKEAYYLKARGEFVLSYAAVQNSEDPALTLLTFLKSTYALGAKLSEWSDDLVVPTVNVPRLTK